jgi:hypothetical protein
VPFRVDSSRRSRARDADEMGLLRRVRNRWDRKTEEVIQSVERSSAIPIALCFDRLYSEDVPPEVAIESILEAAGSDTRGLVDFTDELVHEAARADDTRLRNLAALFTLAVEKLGSAPGAV